MIRSIDFLVTQRCFRTLLRAMSEPGRSVVLDRTIPRKPREVLLTVLCTLLDHEVGFWTIPDPNALVQADEVAHMTGSTRVHVNRADYLVITGPDSGDALEQAQKGEPEFPDKGATVIYFQAPAGPILGPEASPVRLNGPGIPGKEGRRPELDFISPEEWSRIKDVNSEFPLGIDSIFLTRDGKVMAVPRSSCISIDQPVAAA